MPKQMTAAPILNETFDSPAAIALDIDVSSEGAFQRLLENHLPLVRSIVERMRRKLPSKIEADELYSIGVTGLVAAARNYRPSRESSFASYATTRIRGAILDELRRMDWMSRATRSKAKRLGSAISKLEQEQGGTVSQDSLCAEMQMTEDELADLMEEVRPVKFISLDGVDEQIRRGGAILARNYSGRFLCRAVRCAGTQRSPFVVSPAHGTTASRTEKGVGNVLLRKYAAF